MECDKCKYYNNGECVFYDIGSGYEIDMPCYRQKSVADNFIRAYGLKNLVDGVRKEIESRQEKED